jgi:tetratricopeptide (TPR) repeat protein
MKFSNKNLCAAAGAFLAVFLSCQTMQRDLIFAPLDESAEADITALEDRIIRLEARQDQAERGRRDAGFTQELSELRRRIAEIEEKPLQDTVFKARLAAWSGRLYVLEGKTGEAEKRRRASQDADPGNIPALILSARMEGDPQKRLALINDALAVEPGGGDTGELLIEQGRILLVLRRYREAVAAFDTAFLRLTREVYRETYGPSRDRAWELRDVAADTESGTAEILRQASLTWRDVITLTKNETDLLRFLTAGRDWSANDLFTRLADRSFIPPSQDIAPWPAQAKPSLNEQVLRSGAAWFLWRLLAENRADRGLLSRYSSRYADRPNEASPIPDLPLTSPFFDSVLGCIEREIMALPDGRNFVPREPVRGAAFLAMLRKLSP